MGFPERTQLPYTGPFPDHLAPTPQACAHVVAALSALHGKPRRRHTAANASCGGVEDVLDAVVRTILSQNTTNANSGRAMRSFSARFGGDYDAVRVSSVETIAASIACGGLSNVKGLRIKQLLTDVYGRRGVTSLEHLRTLSDEAAMAELQAFKGIGPKTAACVLLFCLGRDSFAVDTHVFRISKQLGWVPAKASREKAFAHLNARVPAELHYDLHVLLVRHGRSCLECAAAHRPQLRPAGPCPLKGHGL